MQHPARGASGRRSDVAERAQRRRIIEAASGIPTGFTELDRLTNGPQPGQLAVVAARPGLGTRTRPGSLARSADFSPPPPRAEPCTATGHESADGATPFAQAEKPELHDRAAKAALTEVGSEMNAHGLGFLHWLSVTLATATVHESFDNEFHDPS
nr:DnaB-like helicase C-terminal domain-containing protein [Actinopolyspora mortivallis]